MGVHEYESLKEQWQSGQPITTTTIIMEEIIRYMLINDQVSDYEIWLGISEYMM